MEEHNLVVVTAPHSQGYNEESVETIFQGPTHPILLSISRDDEKENRAAMPYFPLRKQSEPRIRRHEAYRILATPETYASSGDMEEEEVFPSFEIQTSFNLSSPDKVVVESSKRTILSDDLFSPKPETRQVGPIVANEAVADAWLRMGDSSTFGSKASNSVLPSSATTTTKTNSVPSQSIFRRTSHWWTAPCLHNASLMEATEDHSVTTTTIVHSTHKSTSCAPFWWRTKGRRATDESRGRSRTRHPEVGRRNATGQSLLGSSPTTFRAARNTKVPQASKSTQPLRNGNRVKAGTRVVVASLFDSPPEQQQPIFVSSSSPASCDTTRFNLQQQTLKSLDGKYKQQGGRMTGADCKWKTAVDPKSGKTYFYHVETRETQWRKPIELASDAEREAMQEKERKQRDFFSAMEANILRNLQAGTFASSSSSSPKNSCGMLKNELNLADQDTTNEDDDKNKNTKEKGGKSVKRPDLVRTISSMDERILKDLVLRVPSHRNVGSAGDDSPTDVTTTKSPNHTAAQRLESDDSMEDMEVLSMMESDSSVFPPRPNALRNSKARQPSLGTVLAALPEESVSSMESFGDLSMHDMGLTELESQALINYAQASSQMALLGDESFVGEMDQSLGGLTLEEPEVQEEEDTPPPCNPKDPLQHMDQEPVKRSIARGVGSHRVLSGETALPPKPAKMSRRNTCGTLYVGSTLSQPDVDATIKVSCSPCSLFGCIVWTEYHSNEFCFSFPVCLRCLSCSHSSIRNGRLVFSSRLCLVQ